MSRDMSTLGSPSRPSLPPGRTSSAFNALLSETMGPASTPAITAKEAEIEAWMAPGGRLRIGSDGVPVKFNLHKVAAAKAVATAALRGSPSPPSATRRSAASSSVQVLLRSSDGVSTTTTTAAAAAAAAAVTHDSKATMSTTATTTTTTTTSASSSSAEINHGLQLLVALVGEPAMSQLGLG